MTGTTEAGTHRAGPGFAQREAAAPGRTRQVCADAAARRASFSSSRPQGRLLGAGRKAHEAGQICSEKHRMLEKVNTRKHWRIFLPVYGCEHILNFFKGDSVLKAKKVHQGICSLSSTCTRGQRERAAPRSGSSARDSGMRECALSRPRIRLQETGQRR